ncbi:MAG: transposase family protein [bacterium]|nr:transposase family protein [bacterium]
MVWSLDFMHDTLYSGRRFRTLNVLDDGVRELLAIEVDTSLPGERVVRVLEQIKSWRGLPEAIRCDNGPELLSEVFVAWCEQNGVEIRYIQPGKPNQNAYIERFNKTFRDELLSAYLFDDLDQVRELAWNWMLDYNEERPHDSLGKVPPSVSARPRRGGGGPPAGLWKGRRFAPLPSPRGPSAGGGLVCRAELPQMRI